MKYGKFTKQEKKQIRSQNIAGKMAGSGLYIYQNSSKVASITLPRATRTGLRVVNGGASFQGDDYYMQLVKAGFLRLVEVLQTPEQEKEAQMNESQKLILDQPDQVTEKGTVEHVVVGTGVQKLNEGGQKAKPRTGKTPAKDILLNETPQADGFIVVA